MTTILIAADSRKLARAHHVDRGSILNIRGQSPEAPLLRMRNDIPATSGNLVPNLVAFDQR